MKVKVTNLGVVVPKELLADVAEVEIRKEQDVILIVPPGRKDPIFKVGTNPVPCYVPDASEQLDKYLTYLLNNSG